MKAGNIGCGAWVRRREFVTATALGVVLIIAGAGGAECRETPFAIDKTLTATNQNARAIAAGDLNQDGLIDIVGGGTFFTVNGIQWFENLGTAPPTFRSRSVTSNNVFNLGVRSIRLSDIDGDGDVDIVTGADNGVVIYPSSGGSVPVYGFQIVAQTQEVNEIRVADMDGDDDLDIVTAAGPTNSITWYENNGAAPAGFVSHVIDNAAMNGRSVDVADVNDDGYLDVVAASRDDDKIAVWYGDGGTPPLFTADTLSLDPDGPLVFGPCDNIIGGAAEGYSDGATSVFAADVDGDGDIDVAAASEVDDRVALYLSDGADPPVFTATTIVEDPDGPAYYNCDGDLISGGPEEGFADEARVIRVVDIDQDGDSDIASASTRDDRIAWYDNDGLTPPSFVERSLTVDPDGPTVPGVRLIDVEDNPNDPTDDGEEIVIVQENPREGRVDAIQSLEVADIDVDGHPDLLSGSPGDDKLTWHRNLSCETTFQIGPPVSTASNGTASVFPADIDGDGDIDVVAAATEEDTVWWFENDGSLIPAFTGLAVSTNVGRVQSVWVVDIDQDGDLDIAAAVTERNALVLFENDGSSPPLWEDYILTESDWGIRDVTAADIDGDGLMDLLTAASAANSVTWWRNMDEDPPLFDPIVVTYDADGAWSVHVADVDDDGDLDILSGSINDGKVAWYQNIPPEGPADVVEFVEHIIAQIPDATLAQDGAFGALAVRTGDIDGDGHLDVLSASAYDDKIAWYKSDGERIPTFSEEVISVDPDGETATSYFPRPEGDDACSDRKGLPCPDGDECRGTCVGGRCANTIGSDLIQFCSSEACVDNRCETSGAVCSADQDCADAQCDFGQCQAGNVWYQDLDNVLEGAAHGPASLAPADLDGDGDLDFASTSVLGSTVAWYENDSLFDIGFERRLINDRINAGRSIAVVDLNGDERVDIVTGSFRDDTIWWQLGAIDDACAMFDVNGDGRIDGTELAWLGRAFGEQDPGGAWWTDVDFSFDERIDGADLSILGAYGVWGQTVFDCAHTCARD